MELINISIPAEARVVASHPLHLVLPFVKDKVDLISFEKYKKHGMAALFYYIAIPRWDAQKEFSECESVYSVIRHEVPLTIVKKCDN